MFPARMMHGDASGHIYLLHHTFPVKIQGMWSTHACTLHMTVGGRGYIHNIYNWDEKKISTINYDFATLRNFFCQTYIIKQLLRCILDNEFGPHIKTRINIINGAQIHGLTK